MHSDLLLSRSLFTAMTQFHRLQIDTPHASVQNWKSIYLWVENLRTGSVAKDEVQDLKHLNSLAFDFKVSTLLN